MNMWIIIGLGNPGSKYSQTRHNIGFKVIDFLSNRYNIKLIKKALFELGEGEIEGVNVLLIKPLTYMNNSGQAIKALLAAKLELSDKLIVIHDDIDLNTGTIRIKRKGSSGGHRGVQSIIEELSNNNFIRVKIGIGREKGVPVETYVLENFTQQEQDKIKKAISSASSAVIMIITEGVDSAMNKFNRLKTSNL
ncbi:MAG: aminoacyl-tRNA hydrolase [Thermodesulfovibrionales bacterium]|nr:aminoacyl-tRNA hydrolase [Thermodesulfovibrionales bacterium]